MFVEPSGHVGEDARALQRTDRHQYAQEEEDRRHVDVFHHFRHPVLDRRLHVAPPVVEYFGQHPDGAQRDGHAHVGRQARRFLEHRHEEQPAYAHRQNQPAHARLDALRQFLGCGCGVGGFALAHQAAGQGGGDRHREQRRQNQVGHQGAGRHVAAHPEHDGRHVADGRPCAAAVGRHDDQSGEDPPVALFRDDAPQQHDHDDRCGHVVQHGRHEEGDQRQQPQQPAFVAGPDARGDDVEASVGVDQVDDGHGADQVDQYLARAAQLSGELRAGLRAVACQAEEGPERAAHEQRNGRFVDVDFVFQRDEQVACAEERDHGCDHGSEFQRCVFPGAPFGYCVFLFIFVPLSSERLSCGVMVTQQILVLSFQVRVLAAQPLRTEAETCKGLRFRFSGRRINSSSCPEDGRSPSRRRGRSCRWPCRRPV